MADSAWQCCDVAFAVGVDGLVRKFTRGSVAGPSRAMVPVKPVWPKDGRLGSAAAIAGVAGVDFLSNDPRGAR